MKKLAYLISLLFAIAGCSPNVPSGTLEFPLETGTTWTYSYAAYEPSPSDPAQVIQGTYQLVETVTEAKMDAPYFIAHIERDYELVHIDPGWTGDYEVSLPGEYWYVIEGQEVFESRLPVDSGAIHAGDFLLNYVFPLSTGKTWCLQSVDPNNPDSGKAIDCEFVGKRMVTNHGSYETPAGMFEDCYELTDYYNGGNFIHWFCTGVGIASRKFDHAGTRFGFEQILTDYSKETP